MAEIKWYLFNILGDTLVTMLLKPSYTSVEGGEVGLNNFPLLILKNLLTQKSDLRRLW